MTIPIKYFVYCRKSSDSEERQAPSIESQDFEAKALASNQSLSVEEVLSESQSAKVPGRPVFNSMLDRIERGE